jgi:hypothetical protein
VSVITAAVLALAVVSCAGIVTVTHRARTVAVFGSLADGIALAVVAGNPSAAGALAATRGCTYSIVTRENLAVTVRLDRACGSVEASAELRP